MEILLLKRIDSLGMEGDLVKVADGYARNFLIPSKQAVKVTNATKKLQEQIKQKRVLKAQAELDEAQALADRIANISLTIPVKVGEDEKLYGSVTSKDLGELLKKEGVTIDRRHIMLEESIRSLGVYSIKIDLHPEVKGNLKLWVVKE
jgi:large subunit ribosomal protein L9